MINKTGFAAIVESIRNNSNTLPRYGKIAVLTDEMSKLTVSMLVQDGKTPITDKMETPMGNVADIMLTLFDIIQDCYPTLSGAEIYTQLQHKIHCKYAKWSLQVEPVVNNDNSVKSKQRHWADDTMSISIINTS